MKRISLTIVVGALFLTLFASVAIAATISCAGQRSNCDGTSGDDEITGTDRRDEIEALGGNDEVFARGGNDLVNAGPDNDRVNGGSGDDTLQGSEGNDTITGGTGQDKIYGGLGDDTLRARDGFKDEIHCDGGIDTIIIDRKDTFTDDCNKVIRP